METRFKNKKSSSHDRKERNTGDHVLEDLRERRKRQEDPRDTSNYKIDSSRHELSLEDIRESPDRRDVWMEDIQKSCEMCTLDNDRERREIQMEEKMHVGVDEQFFETELMEQSGKNQRRSHKHDRACERDDSNNASKNIEEEEKEEEEPELPPYLPAIQGCRSAEEYQVLNRIAEGAYGVVYRARDQRTNEIVALKRLKMEKEKEGFPITSLREIHALLKAPHPNIITIREIVIGSDMDEIFIVMDYMEHDLKSLMDTMKQKKRVFIAGEVKCLMQQLLRAVAHLHDNWILHRDLKPSNLLLSHRGILKVGDFGLAREYGSPLRQYTSNVVTLWYRTPELLLCGKENAVLYSTPIDMWSVGCIFAELFLMEPLFRGTSDIDQVNKIFKELGTPSEIIWPDFVKFSIVQKISFTQYPFNNLRKSFSLALSNLGLELLNKCLTYDPCQRITAKNALNHGYFIEAPLPFDPQMFSTWPTKSEQGVRTTNASPKSQSGGSLLLDDAGFSISGFHLA